MAWTSVRDADLDGKRVLVRVDFNVPLEDGKVTDPFRILSSLPTIRLIREKGGIPILVSHLGRPKGEVNLSYSLKPVARCLNEIINDTTIRFVEGQISVRHREALKDLEPGDVVILDNVRFHPGETTNNEAFGELLASFADVFVLDAFVACHRAHASVVGPAKHLPTYPGNPRRFESF
jgi:phosphoglycerate kinase